MRREYRRSVELLGETIELCATRLDDGISILLTGGCSHHIGAVSVTAGQDAELFTHSFPTHKDHIIGERFARVIADTFSCPVSVCCGIHFDNATSSDLAQIVEQCEEMLKELCTNL